MPNLTENFVKKAKSPEKGYKIYRDDEVKGFGLRVTARNVKSFVFIYFFKGRQKSYTLGNYPILNCGLARTWAMKMKLKLTEGIDPLEDRKKNKKGQLFKDFCQEYMVFRQKSLRNSTFLEYQRLLKKNILPKFGESFIENISRRDVEVFHSTYYDRIYTGNRTFQLLSAIFTQAFNWDVISKNPTKGIKKFKEEKKERYLDGEEIKRLLKVLYENYDTKSMIILLIFFTGSRRGEVFKAKWCDFDLEKKVWTKPASSTKQNKMSQIPLNSEAILILKKLKSKIGKESENHVIPTQEFLFFNKKTKKPITDIKNFWQKAIKMAGIDNLRVHDLRHTFASNLVNQQISLEVIAKLLGHSSVATTQRYAHLYGKSLKEASDIFVRSVKDGHHP